MSNEANRNSLFGTGGGANDGGANDGGATSASSPSSKSNNGPSGSPSPKKKISFAERKRIETKLQNADKFRQQGKKAMTTGFFTRSDPHLAANNYKKSADMYFQAGQHIMAVQMRRTAASCFVQSGAELSAAMEFMSAGKVAESIGSDESLQIANEMYGSAAELYATVGEAGRGCDAAMRGALSMTAMEEQDKDIKKLICEALEGAVANYVPDPLNRYGTFRSVSTEGTSSPAVTSPSFAHETIAKAMTYFINVGNYRSALHAAGAVSCILEIDADSTISLSRAYAAETVLLLALGDVVAAEKSFNEVHLQRTSYLHSRECKLAEDLIMAIKNFDGEALAEAQNNRVVQNLDPSVKKLVSGIRISGEARRVDGAQKSTNNPAPNASIQLNEALANSTEDDDALMNELDDLQIEDDLGDDFDLR